MQPATCTNCHKPYIAPCGPAHKATGLRWFCVACATFYDHDGLPTRGSETRIRAAAADQADQHGRSDLAHTFRNGGNL